MAERCRYRPEMTYVDAGYEDLYTIGLANSYARLRSAGEVLGGQRSASEVRGGQGKQARSVVARRTVARELLSLLS